MRARVEYLTDLRRNCQCEVLPYFGREILQIRVKKLTPFNWSFKIADWWCSLLSELVNFLPFCANVFCRLLREIDILDILSNQSCAC